MTHILFLVYGRVQNNANTMQERVISSELIAGLMHCGTESTRVLVQSVERFLHSMDEDGDGIITWKEYLSAVTKDHTILDSFRRAYSVSRRGNMLGVMMFSPLNRFLRRCNIDWSLLTKLWNEMTTTLSQYRVVGDNGGLFVNELKNHSSETKNDANNGLVGQAH